VKFYFPPVDGQGPDVGEKGRMASPNVRSLSHSYPQSLPAGARADIRLTAKLSFRASFSQFVIEGSAAPA